MLVSTVITGENDNTSTQVCSVLKYTFFGFSATCDFFLMFALLPVFLFPSFVKASHLFNCIVNCLRSGTTPKNLLYSL